jgi:hypothetical protein
MAGPAVSQPDDFMAFMNLHDVFLNASLSRSKMMHAPVVLDPIEFLASDRGRFERMWVTFLFVLVEAWQSPHMSGGKDYIASVIPIKEVDGLIEQGRADGSLTQMRNVRDYMCHRDRREYWNAGRLNIAGQIGFHVALHQAFDRVFLAVSSPDKCQE